MKKKRVRSDNGGFVLPSVIILILLLLMFGFGRLASYRYQSISRMELQKKAQDKMALESGMSYLMMALTNYPASINSETNRWVINNELSYIVSGDGHRFEISAYRRGTTETARAELIVYDTTNPSNNIVTGMLRVR